MRNQIDSGGSPSYSSLVDAVQPAVRSISTRKSTSNVDEVRSVRQQFEKRDRGTQPRASASVPNGVEPPRPRVRSMEFEPASVDPNPSNTSEAGSVDGAMNTGEPVSTPRRRIQL